VTSNIANRFIYCLGVVGLRQRFNFLHPEISSDRSWPTGMLIMNQSVQNICATSTQQYVPKVSLPYACLFS
jgi:hypothetical protein